MNDIINTLNELGVDTRSPGESPHVTAGWIGVMCPWCGEGTGKFGLGINLRSLCCSCWKCGHHSLYAYLLEITRVSHKAYQIANDLKKGVLFDTEVKARTKLVIPFGLEPMSESHKHYLKERRFNPDEIERVWGVQGISVFATVGERTLSWRLYIPIQQNSDVVSWTTRSINPDEKRRYINAKAEEESIPKSELLYGGDLARHAVIVCEGPSDVWRIGPGAVATMGVSYSQAQVTKLSRFPIRAICFDSDPKAQERARQLRDALLPFPGQTSVVTIDAEDPGSMSCHEVQLLHKEFLE